MLRGQCVLCARWLGLDQRSCTGISRIQKLMPAGPIGPLGPQERPPSWSSGEAKLLGRVRVLEILLLRETNASTAHHSLNPYEPPCGPVSMGAVNIWNTNFTKMSLRDSPSPSQPAERVGVHLWCELSKRKGPKGPLFQSFANYPRASRNSLSPVIPASLVSRISCSASVYLVSPIW